MTFVLVIQKMLISIVHTMNTGIIKIKMHFCFTVDVPALLVTSSELSAVCILLHFTFMKPIKTHTQGQEVSCELSTHNCTTVCDLLSWRPNHSTRGPNIVVHSKYKQAEKGKMQGRKKICVAIFSNMLNQGFLVLAVFVDSLCCLHCCCELYFSYSACFISLCQSVVFLLIILFIFCEVPWYVNLTFFLLL
jgi:hypothetical protein